MTFLGFDIDITTGNLKDLRTRNILEEGIMQKNLFHVLVQNGVNLEEDFDSFKRFVCYIRTQPIKHFFLTFFCNLIRFCLVQTKA